MRIFPTRFKKIGYIYLLQMLIPGFYLYFMESWIKVILGIALLGLLAIAYILTWWTNGRRFAVIVGFEILLMLSMGALLNPGFLTVVFWPAAAIGQVKNKTYKILSLAVLISSGLLEIGIIAHIHHASLKPWWPMVFAGVAAAVATVYAVQWQKEMYHSRHALQLAYVEIERLSKMAERNRISQDLHDVLGHELALITLKSQLAERLVHRDGDRAQQELREIRDSAKRTLTKVRDYIAQERLPVLEEEWIAAKRLLHAADMTLQSEKGPEEVCYPEDLALSDACSQALAMSLRELTTNIVKHSSASSAKIHIDRHDDSVYLWVGDNGDGFEHLAIQTEGHGLSGITARLHAVNGHLAIWSKEQWLTQWQPPRAYMSTFGPCTTLFVVHVPLVAAGKTEVGI